MIRKAAGLVCILAGLYCLLGLADRWGWANPLWEKAWPQAILPRRPSASEIRTAELDSRVQALKQQISACRKTRAKSAGERCELVRQLREQMGDHAGPLELTCLKEDDPVSFALVRSIDAEERKDIQSQGRLEELEAELSRLEAQQIAVRSGVSLVEPITPSTPSEQLRSESGEETTESRYQRIIREARQTKD